MPQDKKDDGSSNTEELIATSSARTSEMLETKPSPEKPTPKNAYLEKLQKLPKNS